MLEGKGVVSRMHLDQPPPQRFRHHLPQRLLALSRDTEHKLGAQWQRWWEETAVQEQQAQQFKWNCLVHALRHDLVFHAERGGGGGVKVKRTN